MSFLARLAMRAGIPGGGAAEPLLVPKDRGLQRSPRLFREEAPPEQDEDQTLRRQLETEGDEEEVQTLRRQLAGGNDGAATVSVAAPTSEELQPDAPRTGDELPTVRRMTVEPEEEEAQPVRRMMEGQEGAKARPLLGSAVVQRSVRGAAAHGPAALGSATAPAPEIVADQPEPSNLRASGEMPPMPAPAWPPVPLPSADREGRSSRGADASLATLPPQALAETPELPRDRFERPQVVIDRLDVLIHEPAPPARGPDSAERRSRSLRARYLRRL
jgi:hypothetical protein